MHSKFVGLREARLFAFTGDEVATVAKSLPPPELTLGDRRASTEGSDSCCSLKDVKPAPSPRKSAAGHVPASAAISPCLGGESTAATPSPLLDEEFKEETLIAAAAATASDIALVGMLHSQPRRSYETQIERRDGTGKGCAKYNRPHQVHSRDDRQRGVEVKDRDEAVPENAKQTIQQGLDGPQVEEGRDTLKRKLIKPRADTEDTDVCLTLLEAREPLANMKRENSYLRYKTSIHQEVLGVLKTNGTSCTTSSSATFGCATPTTSVAAKKASAFPSDISSCPPAYHCLEKITGAPHKKEYNIPVSLCGGTSACSHSSASPRSTVHCAANLLASGEQQGKSGVTNIPQKDCTGVPQSDVCCSSRLVLSPAASSGVAHPFVNCKYDPKSFTNCPGALRESSPSCRLALRKTEPKKSNSPRGSPCNWKALTQKMHETNGGTADGKDSSCVEGLQSCPAQTLQWNPGSTYGDNSSLRPSTTATTCRAIAETRTYSAKTLLAARILVQVVQGASYAEEAFCKVQRELQTRYRLVERCEEKVPTTPAAEQQQKSGGIHAESGLYPSGGVFPLFTAGHPPAMSTWTDPYHASRKTAKFPPPPPPPPPRSLPQLQTGSSTLSSLPVRAGGNQSIATTVPAAAVRGFCPSIVDSTPLAGAPITVCQSMNSGVRTFPVRGTGPSGDGMESSSNESKEQRTSLNPQAPAFQPKGPSLLWRLLCNAAEHTRVQSHPSSGPLCPRGALNSCGLDKACAFECVRRRGGHAEEFPVEEPCCADRHSVGRFLSDTVVRFAQKSALRTLPGHVADYRPTVFPVLTTREVLLPLLPTKRAEQQQQQPPLSFPPMCGKQLQQFYTATSLQAPLPCASQRVAAFKPRGPERESPHNHHKQHQLQSRQHQGDCGKQHEDCQQVQGCRIHLGSSICPSEQRPAECATSYDYMHAREDMRNISSAVCPDKRFQRNVRGHRESVDSSSSRYRAPKTCFPQAGVLEKRTVSLACMRDAEHSISSGTAVPASSRSPAPFGHLPGQQCVRPAGVPVARGVVPSMTVPISSAATVSYPRSAIPPFPATRKRCSKLAGLDEGLAEVLDPLIANRMLLQLGKTLRLTHLKVLNVIRRASVAGAPLRVTDLPAAFLKEHNAVLDLRSLGLLHIREVVAGMGRSLLLLRKRLQENPCFEEQLRPYEKPLSEAFRRQEHRAAPESLANFLVQSPVNSRTLSTEQYVSTRQKTLPGKDSTAAQASRSSEESGNGKGRDVRLNGPNGSDLCITTPKEITPSGNKHFPGKLMRVYADQKVTPQFRGAPVNRIQDIQHSDATVEGRVYSRASRESLKQEELFSLEDEGDLLLLEGHSLPSVMKELLQHLLVSLIADALHHRTPPESIEGACEPTENGVNYVEVVAPELLHSVHRRGHTQEEKYAHHLEKGEFRSHGENESAPKRGSVALPRTTFTQSTLAAPVRAASFRRWGGYDTLEWSQSRGGGEGPTHTRGLPLQLLPTLWQLKYGVRCNLPAMLETCGYVSVRNFIFDALPCVHFSASGTHVALRLSDASSACPTAIHTAMCRAAEKHMFTKPVETVKSEHNPHATEAEGVLGKETAAVASETVTSQNQRSPRTCTPAVAFLDASKKTIASDGKEHVNREVVSWGSRPSAGDVLEAQAKGLSAQQGQRRAEKLESRPAETSSTAKTLASLETEPGRGSLCQTQGITSHAGGAPARVDISHGGAGALGKQSNAENRHLDVGTFVIAKENENQGDPSGEHPIPSRVTDTEEMSANSSAAGESPLPTVVLFRDSNTSFAATDDRKACPLRASSEELREQNSIVVEAVSPLPTLLASALVEGLAAAKTQTLQQQVQDSTTSSCSGKQGVQAVASTGVWGTTADGAMHTSDKKTASSKPQQHGHVHEDPVSQHHSLAHSAVTEFVHNTQSGSPAKKPPWKAGKATQEKQESSFEKIKPLDVGNPLAITGSYEVEFCPSDKTPAAASPSFDLHEKAETRAKRMPVKTYSGGVTSNYGKLERANSVELMCPLLIVYNADARIPPNDEALPAETMRRIGEAADVGPRTADAKKCFPTTETSRTVVRQTATCTSSASLRKAVDAGSSSLAARLAGNDALVEATDVLLAETPREGTGRAVHVATGTNTDTHTSRGELNGRRATEQNCRLYTPTGRRYCAADAGAPEAQLMEPGLQQFAEIAAPRSRLHLHCMLYEVVATGCEKRGRAWARGEDLIELEEEVRQREAAAAQVFRLQQLQKRQQQQLFQQMVKRKEQLLGQSHLMKAQMQDEQVRRRSEHLQSSPKASAEVLRRSQLYGDLKTGIKNSTGNPATNLATNTSSRHTHVNFATYRCQGHEEPTPQRNNKAAAVSITEERKMQSTQHAGDGIRRFPASERLPAGLAEEEEPVAKEPDFCSARARRDEETGKTKDTAETGLTEDSTALAGHSTKQTKGIASIKSAASVQRREHFAKAMLALGTTTIETCGKLDNAGGIRPCLTGSKRLKPVFSRETVSDCSSKRPKPKRDIVPLQQRAGHSISSSDDGTTSTGPLLSPTGHLLEAGIKVLMDERLVRRKMKKKAKKEKKKRKKLKLRALEMQEQEQRRLLGLVDQLVELPEEPTVSEPSLQFVFQDEADGTHCEATTGAEVKASGDWGDSPLNESICASPSTCLCASDAIYSRKSTEALGAPPPSPKAVSTTPSFGMVLDLSEPRQYQPPVEAVRSTIASQSNALRSERAFPTIEKFSVGEEKAAKRETLIGALSKSTGPSPRRAGVRGSRDATAYASSTHALSSPSPNKNTSVSPSLQELSSPQDERQQLQRQREGDGTLLPYIFAQQLHHNVDSPPEPQQSSAQHQEQRQMKGSNQQQPTSLSLLSRAQLAGELRRYRNRSVGMLVSAIKGEWQRRFGTQTPSLSTCMSLFKLKQLKVLLLEVPNLLILGSGGTMRVSTIEHALQFCCPFPPPPSALLRSPSAKLIASAMTVTPSSPLLCFRAHVYTHDGQSNVPFPLTSAAVAPRRSVTDILLDVRCAPELPPAAPSTSAATAADTEGRTAEEQYARSQETSHTGPAEAPATDPYALTTRNVHDGTEELEVCPGLKETQEYSCIETSPLQSELCTPVGNSLHHSAASEQQQERSCRLRLVQETLQEAVDSVTAAHKSLQAAHARGKSYGRHTEKSAGYATEDDQMPLVPTPTMKGFTNVSPQHVEAGTDIPTFKCCHAESLPHEESSNPLPAHGVTNAPAKPVDSGSSATTTLVTKRLRPVEATETAVAKLVSALKSEDRVLDELEEQEAGRAKRQQKRNSDAVVKRNVEMPRIETVCRVNIRGNVPRIPHVQQKAFQTFRKCVSELRRQCSGTDREDKAPNNQRRELQRSQLQRCLAKLLLAIVQYHFYGEGFSPSMGNELFAGSLERQRNGETWRKQEGAPSPPPEAARSLFAARDLGAELGCAENRAECSYTLTGENSDFGERDGHAKYNAEHQLLEKREPTCAVRESEKRLLYGRLNGAAEAEEEAKDWRKLLRDVSALRLGKQGIQGVCHGSTLPAGTSTRVAEAEEGERDQVRSMPGIALFSGMELAGSAVEPEDAAPPSPERGDKEQQHQERLKEMLTSQQKSEHGLKTNERLKKDEVQAPGNGETHNREDKSVDGELQIIDDCISPQRTKQGRVLLNLTSAGGTDELQEVRRNKLKRMGASPVEVWQQRGSTGVPLRTLLKDWRRTCYLVFREINCESCCFPRSGLTTRSNTCEAKENSCDTALCSCSLTQSSRESGNANSSAGGIGDFASSLITFPAELLSAAGWSSVLPGLLLNPVEENAEERMHGFCLVCNVQGEFCCYSAVRAFSVSCGQEAVFAAAIPPVPNLPLIGTRTERQCCDTQRPFLGKPQHRQNVDDSARGTGKKQQQQQGKCLSVFLCEKVSSISPVAGAGAPTVQRETLPLKTLLPAQGKQLKCERKKAQQQMDHWQQRPLWCSGLHTHFCSAESAPLIKRQTAAAEQVSGASHHHVKMTDGVFHTPSEQPTPAAPAAVAVYYWGSQAAAPSEEAVARIQHLAHLQQSTVEHGGKGFSPHVQGAHEQQLWQPGPQQQGHQPAQDPDPGQERYSLQEALHQRLGQSSRSRASAATCSSDALSIPQEAAEHCRSSRRQSGLPAQACTPTLLQRYTTQRRCAPPFLHLPQSMYLRQSSAERKQQQLYSLLQQGEGHISDVQKQDIFSPQHVQLAQPQLHQLNSHQGLVLFSTALPSEQQPTQSHQRQQMPVHQPVLHLRGRRTVAHGPQQLRQRWLPPMCSDHEMSGVGGEHERRMHLAVDLQHRTVSLPSSEAAPVADNLPFVMPSGDRLPCIPEAATSAFLPAAAYQPYSLRCAKGPTAEVRCPLADRHFDNPVVPQEVFSMGNCTRQSKQYFSVPGSSTAASDLFNSSGWLCLPDSRNTSGVGAACWPAYIAAEQQINQQLTAFRRMFRRNTAAAVPLNRQLKDSSCTVSAGFSLIQREQAARRQDAADFPGTGRNRQLETAAASAFDGCHSNVIAREVEQRVAGLLLVDTAAAAAAASAFAPRASSNGHTAVPHAAPPNKLSALQDKPEMAPTDHIARPYIDTALPSPLQTRSFVVGDATQAPSPQATACVTAGVAATGQQSRVSYSAAGRCGPGSTTRHINVSSKSGEAQCSLEHSSSVDPRAHQLPVAQADIHRQLSKHQSELLGQLWWPQQLSSRSGKKAHMCSPWGVLQQLTGGGGSAPPATNEDKSGTSTCAQKTWPPSSLSRNGTDMKDIAAASIELQKAGNALMLLEHLRRKAYVQQQDRRCYPGLQPQQHWMPNALHPQAQQLTPVCENPFTLQLQKRECPAPCQHPDPGCVYEGQIQQQQCPHHVSGSCEDRFRGQSLATTRHQAEFQQTQERQPCLQPKQKRQQPQEERPRECESPQPAEAEPSGGEPRVFLACQSAQLMPQPQPWLRPQARNQQQQGKSPASPCPLRLEEEAEQEFFSLHDYHLTPLSHGVPKPAQAEFVSGAAVRQQQDKACERAESGSAFFSLERRASADTRKQEDAPQHSPTDGKIRIAEVPRGSGVTSVIFQGTPGMEESKSAGVPSAAPGATHSSSTSQMMCVSDMEIAALGCKPVQGNCVEESLRLSQAEGCFGSCGGTKGQCAVRGQKAARCISAVTPANASHNPRSRRTPVCERNTLGARFADAGVMQTDAQAVSACKHKVLQHAKKQEEAEFVYYQELVHHPELPGRRRNCSGQQSRYVLMQRHQGRKRGSNSAPVDSAVQSSVCSGSANPVTKKQPSPLDRRVAAHQQQQKVWLQRSPHNNPQQKSNQQRQGEPVREQDCANTAVQPQDRGMDRKPRSQSHSGLLTPLHREERNRLRNHSKEDESRKETPQRKLRDTRDELSSYARRVLAQLNTSGKTGRAWTNSRPSPSSNGGSAAACESEKPTAYHATRGTLKQAQRAETPLLAEHQGVQQTLLKDRRKTHSHSLSCTVTVYHDVASGSARRQAEGTAATVEGPVRRGQATTRRPTTVDCISNSVPGKSAVERSISRTGKHAEQRGRRKQNSNQRSTRTTHRAEIRVGPQRAAALAALVSGNEQRGSGGTIVVSRGQAAPLLWRRK